MYDMYLIYRLPCLSNFKGINICYITKNQEPLRTPIDIYPYHRKKIDEKYEYVLDSSIMKKYTIDISGNLPVIPPRNKSRVDTIPLEVSSIYSIPCKYI